jgi:hypothetical protein
LDAICTFSLRLNLTLKKKKEKDTLNYKVE